MSDFIFENKDKLTIAAIESDSDIRLITDAWLYPSGDDSVLQKLCYECASGNYWAVIDGSVDALNMRDVYRVLSKPYTLEYALRDMESCSIEENIDIVIECCQEIAVKLAKSLGAAS